MFVDVVLLFIHVDRGVLYFFFFNDTATTEIYTLPLHDALPIYLIPFGLRARLRPLAALGGPRCAYRSFELVASPSADRKSTRLNSSHSQISYAVFCFKKKKKKNL